MINSEFTKFFRWKGFERDVYYGDFTLNPNYFETINNAHFNIQLEQLVNGRKSSISDEAHRAILFKYGKRVSKDTIADSILSENEHIPDYLSMKVNDLEHLDSYMEYIYNLCYMHYVIGKEINYKSMFPFYCCGISGMNMNLTLMANGFVNSSYVYNSVDDHGYVVLPFVMGEEEQKGYVIADPTSDQLFFNSNFNTRNLVFAVFDKKWEYRTNWKGGSNLFPKPERRFNSGYTNLAVLRKICKDDRLNIVQPRISDLYNRVYDNSVEIEPKFS